MKFIILISYAVLGFCGNAMAQWEGFKEWYPIGDDADIHYKTSYVKSETILFEANPTVRYSIYNNMRYALSTDDNKPGKAFYLAFKPQLRMYTDNSLPVKMPSYKLQLGTQWLIKLKTRDTARSDNLSIGLESGHYSNGQSGSSFSKLYEDGTPQGDSIYTLIKPGTNLSDLLNRQNGNFSTNVTELNFNFRDYRFKNQYTTTPKTVHSLTIGFVLYHDRLLGLVDIGGYSENDIKIYGRMRYQLGYEFTHVFIHPVKHKDEQLPQLSLSEKIELIQGAHPWVNPFRSETRVSYTPGGTGIKGFALFVGFIYGHDNYNYRFVDSGSAFLAGFSWSSSLPPYIKRPEVVILPDTDIEE